MDFQNIILAIVVIIVGYFIIKKLPHIIVMSILGVCIAFTSVFVLRDMLHLPVDDYVDTSKLDELRWQGQDYVDEKSDEIAKEIEGYSNPTIEGYVCGKYITESEMIAFEDPYVVEVEGDLLEYSYHGLNEEKRIEIYNSLSNRIDDGRFREKLLGMNAYVDLEYDLGNAIMYNSTDRNYLIIQFTSSKN